MLVLTRRIGESIVIDLPGGGTAEVTIEKINRGYASISISAPARYPIRRGEHVQQVKKNQQGQPRP